MFFQENQCNNNNNNNKVFNKLLHITNIITILLNTKLEIKIMKLKIIKL